MVTYIFVIHHDNTGSSVINPPKFGTPSGSGLFSGKAPPPLCPPLPLV